MELNYDSITAIAQDRYIPDLVDNIYESSALLSMMREDGTMLHGGTKIVQPVLYAKSTAGGTYTGMEPHDVSEQETRTAAEYDYGHYYHSITVSATDEGKLSGDRAVVNFLDTKFDEAEEALKDDVANDLFTGTSSNGITGLDTVLGTGTYGGIAGATYTWWNTTVDTTAHTKTNMLNSAHDSYIHKLFRTAYDVASHKGMRPNLILTSQDVFDIYEETLQTQARYQMTTQRGQFMADAGFDVLEFRRIPIVVDDFCASGADSACYFINTMHLPMYIHPDWDFTMTPFKVPTNAHGRIAQIYFWAQFGTKSRRTHYRFSDLAN